ncbi:apyrase-like [Anopheles maculipalpis]|uniref:apyrase-like n=1 Tax=Anopheles maculipalpis TaxID=1496333 RepID=UPI0021595BD8|nr:apyrase-like [Anopheles maculipalpis]
MSRARGLYSWQLFASILVLSLASIVQEGWTKSVSSDCFPLTFIHINDLHARFDETSQKSTDCTKPQECIAGIARVYHTIKKLKKDYEKLNPLYLNAGDNFQGTLWYNLLRWNVTAHLIKKLPPDVMTLGNHEFDHSPKGLAPYLAELEKMNIPTVVANLQMNGEPDLKNSKINSSIVLKVGHRKVGIIGALYDRTHLVAQTGKVTLSNSTLAVLEEARKLKQKNVNIIVVLSHCGLDVDKQLANEAGDLIDVIIGAHSHSLLLNKDANVPYDTKYDKIEGDYPIVVEKQKNHKVLITQARSFGKYVGRLTVYFDKKGEVERWEGYPIYMNNSVKQDDDVLRALVPWRNEVKRLGSQEIGQSEVFLDRESCRWCECTLGDLIADAFADNYTTNAVKPIAIIQAGNFRNPIPKGAITNGLAIEAAPYGSSVDMVKLSGEDLWKAVDHSFTLDDEFRLNTLQVSGITAVVDLSKKPYERVQSIKVIGADGSQTPLDKQQFYYVVAPSYLADGKDGFQMLTNGKERVTGPLDSDVLIEYVRKKKTITKGMFQQQRVVIENHTNGTCSWDTDGERFKPK